MTLREVAKRARVSPATVSRVLNNTGRVKATTRSRVLKAIESIGYQPNIHARTLAHGRSQTLGMIVSNLRNPFFLDIYQTLESDAHEAGYEVVVANTDYDPQQLLKQVGLMRGRHLAGLAVIVSEMEPTLLKNLSDSTTPIVCYDVGVASHHCTNIKTDYIKGMRKVVEYLHSLGHRRLAYIGHHTALEPLHARQRSFIEAVEECGDGAGIRDRGRNGQPGRRPERHPAALCLRLQADGDRLLQRLHGPGRSQGGSRDGTLGPGRCVGRGLGQHQPCGVRVPSADDEQRPPGQDRSPDRRGADAQGRGVPAYGGGRSRSSRS